MKEVYFPCLTGNDGLGAVSNDVYVICIDQAGQVGHFLRRCKVL